MKSKTRLYRIWQNVKTRCSNPNCEKYKYYGDKGITICDDWKNNFASFEEWSLKNGYKENLTIDRIDNNKNYEPSNCRWVDWNIQRRNTRKIMSTNTSGYRGVIWHKQNKKWRARIYYNNKKHSLGCFDTKEEAGKAYDVHIIVNNLEHTKNFEYSEVDLREIISTYKEKCKETE